MNHHKMQLMVRAKDTVTHRHTTWQQLLSHMGVILPQGPPEGAQELELTGSLLGAPHVGAETGAERPIELLQANLPVKGND